MDSEEETSPAHLRPARELQGEMSARVLDLTRHLIAFNGADYTAWQWRWRCVVEMGADLAEEQQLTE
jgi:hypothetical protein